MNRLLTPNGGMPLHGDDLQWIQDSVIESLEAIVFPYSNANSGNIIISGCEVILSGGNLNVSEGFAMIGGEVCYCPAQALVVGSTLANVSLKVEETYNPAGNDVFADAISRDTYAIRRAIASESLSGGNEIVLANAPRYISSEQVTTYQNGWSAFGTNPLRISKHGDIVHLSGQCAAGQTANSIFTVPEIYRPQATRSMPLVAGFFNVNDDGSTFFNTSVGGPATTYSLPLSIDCSYRI